MGTFGKPEEYPLLEAVSRRLVKTMTGDIRVCNSDLWSVAKSFILKFIINMITNPIPYIYTHFLHVTIFLDRNNWWSISLHLSPQLWQASCLCYLNNPCNYRMMYWQYSRQCGVSTHFSHNVKQNLDSHYPYDYREHNWPLIWPVQSGCILSFKQIMFKYTV
jgi:hypothetical protein